MLFLILKGQVPFMYEDYVTHLILGLFKLIFKIPENKQGQLLFI